jgi:metastasis-associated protein MTA
MFFRKKIIFLYFRAVGTFSRALDTSSTMKLPSLHMTAAAASRDVALFHAMALLHQANYDIGQAVKYLVPPPSTNHYPLDVDKSTGHNTTSLGGPILCRDQLEEWSAAEATLFEEAIEKCGKDFHDIRTDCVSRSF